MKTWWPLSIRFKMYNSALKRIRFQVYFSQYKHFNGLYISASLVRYFLKFYATISERFQLDAILISCYREQHHLASTHCKKFAISIIITTRLQETADICNMNYRRLLILETLYKVPFISSFNPFPLPQGCQNW